MSITPKNWDQFQHYKNRSPAWIKLHRGLLDDFEFFCLPIASRALAPLLWLLASEYENGEITATPKVIAFRLRMSEADLVEAFKPLVDAGFFTDASGLLAACKQSACLEKEREEEREERKIRVVASATHPAHEALFEEFWKSYPSRGTGSNPKKPARKLFFAAIKRGTDPQIMIAAIKALHGIDRTKLGTGFVPQATKWLGDERYEGFQEKPDTSSVIPLPPRPGLPSHEELTRRALERLNADCARETEAEAGDRDGDEGELLATGPSLRGGPPGDGSWDAADHSSRSTGMVGLGSILQQSPGLAALRVEDGSNRPDQGDDGPDAMAAMV